MTTLAVIDVGTNSTHLLVAAVRPGGAWRILRRERQLTRLGESGLVTGALTSTAMRRTLAVLRRYAATLKRLRVDRVDALATSAVREARNGRAFIRRARAATGLPLRIISGREEARLIYCGVVQANRLRGPVLLISLGGGSAQVMCGQGASLRYATSALAGSARLAQRFIRHDPPSAGEGAALQRHLRRLWAPVIRAVRRRRWRQALGSSAMIHQLLLAARHLARRRQPRDERLSISRPQLQRMVEWLARSRAAQRRRLRGLDPQREDLALTTGVALLTWMEGCGLSSLRDVPGSLREGVVCEYLMRQRHRRPSRAHAAAAQQRES